MYCISHASLEHVASCIIDGWRTTHHVQLISEAIIKQLLNSSNIQN